MTDEWDVEGNLLPDAQRLAKVGKVDRSTSIDELPQLINVLKGDMALIGPRLVSSIFAALFSRTGTPLLEVFSTSTLEAMHFQLPIVATDFDFNRDVLADACLYYEPNNAHEAAKKIEEYIETPSLQQEMKEKMSDRLLLFNDYDKHFDDILAFLVKVGEGKIE